MEASFSIADSFYSCISWTDDYSISQHETNCFPFSTYSTISR